MFMNAAERESPPSMARAAEARSAFARLNDLLAPEKPGMPPIGLAVGEPQHSVPPFVGPVLAANLRDFNRYPANRGTDAFRDAVTRWLARRYALPRPLDPAHEAIVLAGTREGLFLAAIAARHYAGGGKSAPAILIPNPFYAAYGAGAAASQCEAVYMPATSTSGFLPDLDSLSGDLLARTVAFYLASPANPQGSVADAAYLKRLIGLARKHGFMLFCDECYSEIYSHTKPPGALERAGPDYANVVVFNSLSKRSNLAGLRVGFAAGDRTFLDSFIELRNVSAPQVPMPAQAVAVAAYDDEAHVEENRALYKAKFDLADQIVGDRYGYRRPAGGFFLWLDVSQQGGGEAAALKLWREAGVRVLPGGYTSRTDANGGNPGEKYIRVAMVQDKEATAEALHRLVTVLG
jgi:aspartate/methionine/tyrosine aminotransferase